MTCLPFLRALKRAPPMMAKLLDSVAPDVQMISLELAPMSLATCSRAALTPSPAAQPKLWLRLDALPKTRVM